MKQFISIIIALTIFLSTFAQNIAASNFNANSNFSASGIITFAALSGSGANGYITPTNGNVFIPEPKLAPKTINFNYSVFPNPAYNAVSLKISAQENIQNFKLELFSLNGQKINTKIYSQFNATNAFAKVNLNGLTPGFYIVRFILNNYPYQFTILKY